MSNAGRRHPVHHEPVEKLNRATLVFLTVCTKHRKPLLNNPKAHESLRKWWIASTHWLAGRYMILPDHIHWVCSRGSADVPLHRWVAYWKNRVARDLAVDDETFWQRDFWDVQMRSHAAYEEKWQYVLQNPIRHGLAKSSDDWTFQGEVRVLDWHG